MVNRWRPKGWSNPYDRTGGKARLMAIPIRNPGNAFEVGADAMLEALRKAGRRTDGKTPVFPEPITSLQNGDMILLVAVPARLAGKCTVVLVPDDEVKA